MATSSAEAGFLAPGSSPIYDDPFADALQAVIVGITGLAGQMVRPMWIPEPPVPPSHETSWISFGVITTDGDRFAYAGHDPALDTGLGADRIEADELIQVRHSFYGPQSQALCQRYRRGLEIGQNRAPLLAISATIVEVGEARSVPALLMQKWVRKVDVMATFRRRAVHVYPIRTVITGGAGLDNEFYVTPIVVSSNP